MILHFFYLKTKAIRFWSTNEDHINLKSAISNSGFNYNSVITTMALYTSVFAFILFVLEVYHILGHFCIMLRVRMLPRKDLTRLRLYFFVDLLTVFCSSVLFLRKHQWLAALQIAQHLYYVVCWDKTKPAKKIISWSSLDWVKSDFNSEWHWDSILGTLFDIAVHAVMTYGLGSYLSTVAVFVAILLATSSLNIILWSRRFAWSSPHSEPPEWVQKRIQPLTEDKARWF